MDIIKLLQTQKNDLLKMILDEKFFNPKDFKITMSGSSVTYKDSDYKFIYYYGPRRSEHIIYCPGEQSYEESHEVSQQPWISKLVSFQNWLENLKKEVETPDLWKELLELKSLDSVFVNEDEGFNSIEKELILKRINEIEKEIKGINIPKNIQNEIIDKLNSTLGLLDKLTKKQWIEYFLGAMIGYIFNLALDPENIKSIWYIIKPFFNEWIPLNY